MSSQTPPPASASAPAQSYTPPWEFRRPDGSTVASRRRAELGLHQPVEFRTVQQLLAYQRPQDLNLIGDMHLHRGGLMILAGNPGSGKSRALCALALAGALGQGTDWFGLPVHTPFRTLILQGENGPERLRSEWQDIVTRHHADPTAPSPSLTSPSINHRPSTINHLNPDPLAPLVREKQRLAALEAAAGEQAAAEARLRDLASWVRISLPPAEGFRFDSREFQNEFRHTVETFQPHVIGIDPWMRLAENGSITACRRALALLTKALPHGFEPPAFAIVAHTRRPRAEERGTGRALLHLVSGSVMLTAAARSVFVLQHASDDVTEHRVVLTCCKNNDGELGPRSAWVRRNGLFAPVPDAEFDWSGFDHTVGHRSSRVTLDHLRTLFAHGTRTLPLLQATQELIALANVSRATAYRALSPTSDLASHLIHNANTLSLKQPSSTV